jgi:hypothetical protein
MMGIVTDLLAFHVHVHARPAEVTAGQAVVTRGQSVVPLRADQAALISAWPITFDEALASLTRLPRMFIELDGSFVWVSAAGEKPWQVDGVLNDRGQQLAYVELRGTCAPDAFGNLLSALGWPQTPLLFQLVAEGLLLDEGDFHRVAAV